VHTAARVVRAGGVVAYPTEAVYGLGCVPTDERALARLIAIKRRDARKGFLLIAADLAQLEPFAELPGEPRRSEILASWPGPVTWVLAARRGVSALLTGGRRTIAVRVTAHPLARELCAAARTALVSTSANRSARRPARSALAVRRALGRDIDYVLAGPLGGLERPTTIRDGATGAVLRG